MLLPSEETVLGDFDDAEFDYFGIKSKFYRKGDEFWVTTDGPEGISQSYRVEYTFGVEPLQQYLIKFPDGRMQALSICWDTEAKKWFHLHSEQKVDSSSPLHWTGSSYNWNFMCAECHSTGVNKNYDVNSDSYRTSFEEVNVSCESCHGPGSAHLDFLAGEQLPNHGFSVELEGRGPWKAQTENSPPLPAHPARNTDQLDTCARCHSRRVVFSEAYRHGEDLGQTHSLSILSEGLYHSDGQIDDEVYVYGSFLQSKMYQAGVVCTDCHDPHTARLRAEGDSLCLSCHQPSKYQAPDHSHHQGVSCLDCHMPGKLYMTVDYRRDHSFRVPRPDISSETGSPNACNQCHQDKSPEWTRQAYLKWYGEGPSHHGVAFSKLRNGDPSALTEAATLALDKNVPSIVRATAVSLAPLPEVVTEALKDESALVRREAVRSLLDATADVRSQLLTPLASDPIRDVRLEAGRLLADTGSQDPAVGKAIEEYQESLDFNSDRMESRLGKVDLLTGLGQFEEAEKELLSLLQRYPKSVEVYLNGADFYRVRGTEAKGKALLEKGISETSPPEVAALHHSLGLLSVREKDYEKALVQLESAFIQRPDNPRYALVYAVALDNQGRTSEAVTVLQKAAETRPRDAQLLQVLQGYRDKLK
jgi:predicted CXXCH cytochrome family protein